MATEEPKTEVTAEDIKVVEEIKAERKENKKTKRKVVKDDKPLKKFLKNKKQKQDSSVLDDKTLLAVAAVGVIGAVGGYLYYTQSKPIAEFFETDPKLNTKTPTIGIPAEKHQPKPEDLLTQHNAPVNNNGVGRPEHIKTMPSKNILNSPWQK